MEEIVDQQQVLEALTPVFHDVLDNDSIVLSRELSAGDVKEWDSLSHIRLVVAVEQAFGISFKSTEISDLENLGEMVDLILEKLG